MKICVKLLIVRYHFIRITLSKPHLVCTFFNPLELISSSIGSRVGNQAYSYKFGHKYHYFLEKNATEYFRG